MNNEVIIKDGDLLGESYLVLSLCWDRDEIELLGQPEKIQTFEGSPHVERLYKMSKIYDMEDSVGQEIILVTALDMRRQEKQKMEWVLANVEVAHSVLAKWESDPIFAPEPEEARIEKG